MSQPTPARPLDGRARTHIKALLEEAKHQTANAPAPAQMFFGGMLSGLAAAVEILDGGTAEGSMETIVQRMSAAIGQAYLDGNLPAQPEQAMKSDPAAELAKVDSILRDYGIEYPLGALGVKDLVNMARLLREDRQRFEGERDGAYRERAHLVALLAAMTPGAVITYATDIDEPGWQIVYLNLGGRQASWHISPRDADLFQHLERVEDDDPRGHWDGHTTEEKYLGIAAWTAELMERCGPECAEMHTEAGRCVIARKR